MDLYENDCIFDKFDACFSGSGAHVATGSYSNCFRVVSRADGADATLEASRDPQRKRLTAGPSKVRPPLSPHFSSPLSVHVWCGHSSGVRQGSACMLPVLVLPALGATSSSGCRLACTFGLKTCWH